MDDQQLDLVHFKERLLALRRELEKVKEIGSEGAETVELDQTRTGRLTRMDAMQAQAMSLASRIRREAQLRQVDAALKRIKDDNYGWCDECGERIDARRLDFDPTTQLCITCAKQAEQV